MGTDPDRGLWPGAPAGAGRPGEAISALGRALWLYGGDLFPEDGPEEWLVRERERFRAAGAEACRTLAEVLQEEGDPLGAARACERGLAIDRHQDSLWRALWRAHESAGNHAAAADAHRRYERVLVDLGIGLEPVSTL